jgi:integrase/recombinase XerC
VSVRRVRRGVYQVRWREGGRGSPAHSVMVYGTNDAEARRKADTVDAELRNRKAAGERVVSIAVDRPEPLTLSEFLVVWHGAHGKELAASTQVSYAGVWDKWIGPRLGTKLLQDLTPAEVARFRAAIEREGAGAPTVLRVLAVLGSVLSEAVRQGQIATSPTRAVSRPRQRRQRAVRPPTPERVEIIRAGLDSEVDRALVTLLAYVGLRPQEALAAVWSDVLSGKLVIDAPKTGRTRVVPLLPVVRQELAALQLRQGRPGPAAPIIATSSGGHWSDSRFRSFRRHRWSKVAPGMRPYDLRHAYVSLMIQGGHTVVEVAKWAGHSPHVCLSTYAHLFDTVTERIDPDQAVRAARYGTGADQERAAG